MVWPCAGPMISVCRISMSRVPCSISWLDGGLLFPMPVRLHSRLEVSKIHNTPLDVPWEGNYLDVKSLLRRGERTTAMQERERLRPMGCLVWARPVRWVDQ